MKQDEIDRCLVMLYASRSNDMHVNYNLCCKGVKRLCANEPAKAELVSTLRMLADQIAGSDVPIPTKSPGNVRKTGPVVAVWELNGDVERMDLGINSAPLKGFTHIYQQLICACGISLPRR